jgi:hypothetical protein
MQNRVQYKRPQGMLWSRNQGTLQEGFYVPDNSEYGSDSGIEDFIVLSDHNRDPINFNKVRIENRKRMINGTMRSYHIADKLEISTSWTMLPSRAFSKRPGFSSSAEVNTGTEMYTSDGGAGGEEMLRWYNDNTGPIWVFLAYDRYTNFGDDNDAYTHLGQYNEVIQMYITSFDYSVEKRGGENHDLWNVRVTLEEV